LLYNLKKYYVYYLHENYCYLV